MSAPPQETVQNIVAGVKVAGGGTVTGWLATVEPYLAVIVGFLTAAVLAQTLYRNWKK